MDIHAVDGLAAEPVSRRRQDVPFRVVRLRSYDRYPVSPTGEEFHDLAAVFPVADQFWPVMLSAKENSQPIAARHRIGLGFHPS
jgi:hypothetical protein